ncbi:MAG: fluoride efflux transporter CrcB [Anaerolineales bacterium]|nr:fluoride efflux transporter CrcB [Anaerolineales bacterium]
MEKILIISIGAVLGANARYWLGGWAAEKFGTAFPYGTFIINLTGSFILGLFITLVTDRFLVDPNWRLLVTIGFLGSYTTFSSYTFESVGLILENQWLPGLFNLFGSAFLGGLTVLLGILIARAV